jgi:hypothetical protein
LFAGTMQDGQDQASLAHGTISAFFSQFRPHFIPFQVRFSHVLQSFVVVSAASSSASDSTPSYIFSHISFSFLGWLEYAAYSKFTLS